MPSRKFTTSHTAPNNQVPAAKMVERSGITVDPESSGKHQRRNSSGHTPNAMEPILTSGSTTVKEYGEATLELVATVAYETAASPVPPPNIRKVGTLLG